MPLTMGELPDDGPRADAGEVLPDELEVDLPPETDDGTIYHDDGSVEIVLGGESIGTSTGFDENLAESLVDEQELNDLALSLLDLVEADIEARSKRDEQYADGIRRTGLGNDAPGGANFDGASKVVHPMLAQGCVDFASRAVKELSPAGGPCKIEIIGDKTEEKLDRAERKKTYMNWQLTSQIAENRPELERVLSQVPLGGAQYKRWWFDPELKRARTEAVYIDDVFTPYGHSDFYTSPRVTHRQRILESEYQRRIRTGLYRDLELSPPAMTEDESRSQVATDRVEGAQANVSPYIDGLRTVYQIDLLHHVEGDPLADGPAQYVLHLDKSTRRVLGLYRNWPEDGERHEKQHWMTEWPFIPWRGGPAIGLAHLIGTMAGAATGALRAVLDAAHFQNFPGGLKLKGGKNAGQSIQVNATQLQEIEGPPGATDPDIRKLVMPFPFAGPSAVLFSVLEWLTQQGNQVVNVATEAIADAGPNMPVGTVQALIEHGSVNFSAIHARLHNSMRHDLAILHRLNKTYLEDEQVIEELGELVVRRADFEGPVDVIPVSDPNIFTEAQRIAQLQALFQLKNDPAFAPYFKPDQLLARALKLLQIPDPEGVANVPREAERLSPLTENYTAGLTDSERRPLKAYQDQNHIAHLKAHIHYGTSPMWGANPMIAGQVLPILLDHCREHMLMVYREYATAGTEAWKAIFEAQGQQLDEAEIELQGQAFAEWVLMQVLGPVIMPGLQAIQQQVQQLNQAKAPQPSPDVALVQATFKEVELKKLEYQSQKAQVDLQRAAEDRASQERLAQLATNVELMVTQQNNAAEQLQTEYKAQAQRILETLKAVLGEMVGGGEAAQTVLPDGTVVEAATPSLADLLTARLAGPVQQLMLEAVQGTLGSSPSLVNMVQLLAQQQDSLKQILEGQQATNQQAFQALAQSVQQLAAQLQPQQAQPQQQPPG